MKNLSHYFGSYAHPSIVVPESQRLQQRSEINLKTLREQGTELTRVSLSNQPEFLYIINQECSSRNIRPVPFYTLDDMPYGTFPACASYPLDAVVIDPKFIVACRDHPEALRALAAHEIKHLYQGEINFEDSSKNNKEEDYERDSDWAALTSAGRKGVLTLMFQSMQIMPEGVPELSPCARIKLSTFLDDPKEAVTEYFRSFSLYYATKDHPAAMSHAHNYMIQRISDIQKTADHLQLP